MRALEDIIVLDLTHTLSGPYATTLLAEFLKFDPDKLDALARAGIIEMQP